MHYFLTTARLGFRVWTDADLDLAVSLWGEPQVMALIDARGQLTREQVKERLESEIRHERELGIQYWPCFLLDSGEFVGCAGLKPYDMASGIYELGFHLRPPFWGAGLATEAATAVIDHAFRTLKAAALRAGHSPHNPASRRVLEKLGFTYLRDEYYAGMDALHPLYELTRAI